MSSPLNQKVIISPGQALLLLMDAEPVGSEKFQYLAQLYLSGAETEHKREEMLDLFQDASLASYEVSLSARSISEDATRRYFETHLAYQTLSKKLDVISGDDLRTYAETTQSMLKEHAQDYVLLDVSLDVCYANAENYIEIEKEVKRITGMHPDESDGFGVPTILKVSKEYFHYIKSLQRGDIFPNLSKEDREKIKTIAQISYMSLLTSSFRRVPLNIYGQGYFRKESIITKRGDRVTNDSLGLMKHGMPLPYYNEHARHKNNHEVSRAVDHSTFHPYTHWSVRNFERLVHPFSAGISGTMLGNLRVLLGVKDDIDHYHYLSESRVYSLEDTYLFSRQDKTLILHKKNGEQVVLINDEHVFDRFYDKIKQRFSLTTLHYGCQSLYRKDIEKYILAFCDPSVKAQVFPDATLKCPFLQSESRLSCYLTCLASTLLFYSGGHSYFEFLSPIFMQETQEAFRDIPGFSELTMNTMLYANNQEAFNEALRETRQYNHIMIQKKCLLAEIPRASHAHQKRHLIEYIETLITATQKANPLSSWAWFLKSDTQKKINLLQRTLCFIQDDNYQEAQNAFLPLKNLDADDLGISEVEAILDNIIRLDSNNMDAKKNAGTS